MDRRPLAARLRERARTAGHLLYLQDALRPPLHSYRIRRTLDWFSKARQHAMHKRRLRFLMHMVFH